MNPMSIPLISLYAIIWMTYFLFVVTTISLRSLSITMILFSYTSKVCDSWFYEFNNVPNSTSSILDLGFSNYKRLAVDQSNVLAPIDQYHPTLDMMLPAFSPISYCISNHYFYNFPKANYNNIRLFISLFSLVLYFSILRY